MHISIFMNRGRPIVNTYNHTDRRTNLPGTTVITFKDRSTLSAFINDNLLNASINVKYLRKSYHYNDVSGLSNRSINDLIRYLMSKKAIQTSSSLH